MSRALNAWWNQRVPIGPAERELLLIAFRGWAAQRELRAERHDACFDGELFGCGVHVETGLRTSGAYDVVVHVDIETMLPGELTKPGKGGPFASTFADPRVLSVRVLDVGLEVRLAPGSPPDAVERASEAAIGACRALRTAGAYR